MRVLVWALRVNFAFQVIVFFTTSIVCSLVRLSGGVTTIEDLEKLITSGFSALLFFLVLYTWGDFRDIPLESSD